jgi:VCBS repeat-containing protein
VVDEFAVTVTDSNGNTNTPTASLDILITDTSPTAKADARTVGEDDTGITGNVETGTNATADTLGADSADITGVQAGTTASEITTGVNTAVSGTYGDLTIKADGSYTYVTNASAQALNTGDTKTDTFSYTLKDSDGDFSTTTFTFTITGADEVISVLGATEGDASNSWVNAGNTNSLNAQIDYTDKGYGVSNKNGNNGNQTSALEGNESILFDLGAEVSNANFKITLLDSSQTLTGQWIAYSQSRQEVGQGDVTGSGDVNINNLTSFRYIEFDAHKNGNGNGNAFYVKPILSGDNTNNSIVGDNQNNFILGGKGDDSLTGGQGDDIFIWQNNETGTDTITDWDTGANKLDLSELLQEEGPSATAATLDDFLDFSYNAIPSKTTLTIDVDGSGGGADQQKIVFEGVDLTQSGALSDDQAIINNLLGANQLITD